MIFFRRKTEALLLVATGLIILIANVALELSRANTAAKKLAVNSAQSAAGAGTPTTGAPGAQHAADTASSALHISTDTLILTGGFFLLFFLAHLVLSWKAPHSDQIMLPTVALLNGLGLVMITRLDMAHGWSLARSQLMWTCVGVVLLCGVVLFFKDHRSLQNYTYIMGITGLILTALPIVWPTKLNADANVWISIGPFSIQPGEFAKLLLLFFFAGLLIAKRRLFNVAGKTLLGLQFPRLRDLGPLLLVWGIALVIMAAQNDFGPALILFATVLGMLYMATNRTSWLLLGVGLSVVGAVGVYQISGKIQNRVANFVDPLGHYYDPSGGFQLSQALFGMSFGGVTGTGLGEGYPYKVPVAHSDFILAAFGEEIGLIGLAALLVLYAILISRAFRTSMKVADAYGKLITAGMALTIAVQIFVVTGGISRLMPMTGLTTPFLSHGGSSLLANYILLALLLRISHTACSPEQPAGARSGSVKSASAQAASMPAGAAQAGAPAGDSSSFQGGAR